MIFNIITYIITTILGLVIGFLVHQIKVFSKRQKNRDEAFLILLKSNLTNTYYAYEKLGEIPDYVLQGWLDEYKVYEEYGGNTYVGVLKEKIVKLKIVHTDILL